MFGVVAHRRVDEAEGRNPPLPEPDFEIRDTAISTHSKCQSSPDRDLVDYGLRPNRHYDSLRSRAINTAIGLGIGAQGAFKVLDNVERLLLGNSDICAVGQPQSNEEIENAERRLEVEFPDSYRTYLRKWGWISFGPHEYFGLGSDVNCVVSRTLEARARLELPKHLLLVCDREGDEYICIDTRTLSGFGNRVVAWETASRRESRTKADSYESFLVSDMLRFIE